jgi:hypothetical protein
VQRHLDTHKFEWYFAVAPVEMTRSLIDDFGITVANAPSAPAVLICGDQTTRFLRTGVKTADELSQEIAKCS